MKNFWLTYKFQILIATNLVTLVLVFVLVAALLSQRAVSMNPATDNRQQDSVTSGDLPTNPNPVTENKPAITPTPSVVTDNGSINYVNPTSPDFSGNLELQTSGMVILINDTSAFAQFAGETTTSLKVYLRDVQMDVSGCKIQWMFKPAGESFGTEQPALKLLPTQKVTLKPGEHTFTSTCFNMKGTNYAKVGS